MNNTQTARTIIALGLAVWLGSGAIAFAKGKPGGGGPPSCTDLPVTFSLDQQSGPGISNDGNPLYEDGVDNVQAQILICGTGDATLNTNTSYRTLQFDFTSDATTTNDQIAPDWTNTNPNWFNAFLNVRSLVNTVVPCGPDNPPDTSCSFTTTMGTSFKAPDRKSYGLRMVNEDVDIGPRQDATWVNVPQMTSKVRVTYFPASDAGGERWEVQSDPDHIATLIKNVKGNQYENAGQFNMPFRITIRRK